MQLVELGIQLGELGICFGEFCIWSIINARGGGRKTSWQSKWGPCFPSGGVLCIHVYMLEF